MLEFLSIRNLALVEDLEIEFAPGLNALTGETGAGKSFILRALNFLTGEKLTKDMVRQGREKALVEAQFTLNGEEWILRRELSGETGRSRLFVNDSLSSQEAVRPLGSKLMLHTSQHGRMLLLQSANQARILDEFVADKSLIRDKDQLLARIKEILARKRELMDKAGELRDKRDYLEFQLGEIEKVGPKPGEEEELLSRKKAGRDQEKVRETVENALNVLHGPEFGFLKALGGLQREVESLAAFKPDYADAAEALEEFRVRFSDLDARLKREGRDQGQGLDMEALEARLYELSRLRRKLNRSLDEIGDLRQEIKDNLSFLDSWDLDMRALEAAEAALAKELEPALADLNSARREAAKSLGISLADDLRDLGFPREVRVTFEFESFEVYPGLFEDRAELLWVPNPGQDPKPLEKIASGGELSRLLLALACLLSRENLPTLVFDEVDAGIGGLALNRVGERLRGLAEKQQIILITHWPQLAVLAGRHFSVRKEILDGRTRIFCERLDRDEIFEELSRMAGGGKKGEVMAGELLQKGVAKAVGTDSPAPIRR
ncbi:MAG: AAA family ATPase [Thermodesulfobacteriota bacterium]|nr:AAA family ATPase [Thermodesulfobacteriota bacterium]